MFESKAGILFIAGLGFFGFAFVSNATVPMLMYQDMKEQTVRESVTRGLATNVELLERHYPVTFNRYYGVTGARLLELYDANRDNRLAEDELGAKSPFDTDAKSFIEKLDTNKNGRIEQQEFENAGFGPGARRLFELFDESNPDLEPPGGDGRPSPSPTITPTAGPGLEPEEVEKLLAELKYDIDPAALLKEYDANQDKVLEGEELGAITVDRSAEALRLGRQVYIGEGCWHCHSQFVRPVSNESRRWGPVAETREFQNELQRPVMFGTRRVGPDLSREGGRRGNDWHAVHFYRPKMVSPNSPMPEYPWFFEGSPDAPNKRGLAIIAYVQLLGSWLDSYPYYEKLESSGTENYSVNGE